MAGDAIGRAEAIRSSPVLVPLQAVFAVNGALYGTLLPRYPQIADRIDASPGAFGLALLGAGVGGIVGSALVTSIGRRVGGPARATAAAAPLMVVAAAAAGAAPSVLALFAALAVLGLADGVADPSMNAVAAAEQVRIRTAIMGRLHATWSAATLTATGIGALVAGLGVGVVPHVLVSCAVLLPIHVVASRAVVRHGRDLRATADGPTPGAAPGIDEVEVASPRRTQPLVVLWTATIIVSLAAVLIEIPPQEWSGLLLQRELGTGPGLAGAGPFTFLAGALAGRLVLDRLVDAFGWRRVGVAAAAASLVGMSLGLVVAAMTASPWPLLIGLAVAGSGAAPHFPLLFDRAPTIAAQLGLSPDAGAGLISTVTRAAMLIGPLAVGQVADRAGLFVGLALVPAVAAAMLPGLVVLLRPRS